MNWVTIWVYTDIQSADLGSYKGCEGKSGSSGK